MRKIQWEHCKAKWRRATLAFVFTCTVCMVCVCAQADQGFSSEELVRHGLSEDGVSGIRSVAVLEDVFYALVNNGKVISWHSMEQRYESIDVGKLPLDFLAAGEGKLYAANTQTGEVYLCGEAGLEKMPTALPAEIFVQNGTGRGVRKAFVNQGFLYALVDESESVPDFMYPQFAVAVIPLQGGECKVYRGEGIRDLCMYGNHAVLALGSISKDGIRYHKLRVLNLQTEAWSELNMAMPTEYTPIAGLAYDEEKDIVYYANDGALMQSVGQAAFVPIAPLRIKALVQEATGWILSDKRYALFSYGVSITHAEGTDPQKTLIISWRKADDELWNAFLQKRADVTVLTDAGELSAAEVTERIRNGDSKTDLFCFRVDSSFRALLNKGYAADLSASAVIREDMTALYPALASTLTDAQGRPMAYPVHISMDLWQVNQSLWTEFFSQEPLPTTFPAFLEAMLRFEQEHGAQGDAFFVEDYDYVQMTQLVLNAYIQSYAREAEPLRFGLPALYESLSLLAKVEALRAQRKQGSDNETRLQLTDEEMTPCVFTSTGGGNVLITSMKEQDSPWQSLLPFVFEKGESPVIPGMLWVMTVNPHSQRQALAREFLEGATKQETNPVRYSLIHASAVEALPRPDGHERVEALQQQRGELTRRIQQAQAQEEHNTELAKMQEELRKVERNLKYQSFLLWVIPPDGLADYQSIAPYIHFLDTACFAALDQGATTAQLNGLVQRYCQGSMKISVFLQKLEAMMKLRWGEA